MEHGGILCYVKDGIAFKERSDLHTDDIEALWIEITLLIPSLCFLVQSTGNLILELIIIDKLDHIFQDYSIPLQMMML